MFVSSPPACAKGVLQPGDGSWASPRERKFARVGVCIHYCKATNFFYTDHVTFKQPLVISHTDRI